MGQAVVSGWPDEGRGKPLGLLWDVGNEERLERCHHGSYPQLLSAVGKVLRRGLAAEELEKEEEVA